MSQHVQTYAIGTRVRIVPDEVAASDGAIGADEVGTVMSTSNYGDGWTIWVTWDSKVKGPWSIQIGYTFEQLEAVDE